MLSDVHDTNLSAFEQFYLSRGSAFPANFTNTLGSNKQPKAHVNRLFIPLKRRIYGRNRHRGWNPTA